MTLFTPANALPETRNLRNSVWGLPKTGKTTHYLGDEELGMRSYPLPLFVLDFDLSLVDLLPRASQKTRDNLYRIQLTTTSMFPAPAERERILNLGERAAAEALDTIEAIGQGTIVFDTGTHYWEYLQWSMFGDPSPDAKRQSQLKYGPLNARFSNTMTRLWASPADVVLTHHAREVYQGAEPTGTYRPRDQSSVGGIVQTQIHFWYADKPTPRGLEREYGSTIQFCRTNRLLAGVQMERLDYPMLYEAIYGTTSPKEVG